MAAPELRLDEVQAFVRDVPTRMPFRFGSVTMTELSVVYMRVRFESERGDVAEGVSASVLSPMWFDKRPELDYAKKQDNLLIGASLAACCYIEAGGGTAHELHAFAQPEVRRRCAARDIPALPSSFGVALIDGAIVDGLCGSHRVNLHAALREDLLGFGPVPGLPDAPRETVHLRHTVGLVDPLTAGDVTEPLGDGLPETLEAVVREYGVTHFKIKIADDSAANLERLAAIQAVLAGDYKVVLDGNESYADMASFAEFFAAYSTDPTVAEIFAKTLWFEQPVHRDASLDDSVAAHLARLGMAKPVILDESDGTDETVDQALALGYGGVSAKNCKGIFRTLHSFRALQNWRARHPEHPAILAAEDLTHPGMRALQQDTAVIAALGISHAERNGHHYVRGLDFLSEKEQEVALRDFAGLYERTPAGLLRLAIREGRIDTRSCVGAYGAPPEFDYAALTPLPLPDPGDDE